MRYALLFLLLYTNLQPTPPPARPALTIPIDGDDTDTYAIKDLEAAAAKARP